MARLHDNPLLPADAGLSSLGLLMRVGGAVGFWSSLIMVVAATAMRGKMGVALVLLLGVGRSWMHMQAGRRLQQSAPEAMKHIWLYLGFALVHLVALLLIDAPADLKRMLAMVFSMSLGWPLVVLGLVMRPAAKRVIDTVSNQRTRIFAEDGGILGAAALMTAMGTVGVFVVGLWSVTMISGGLMRAGFIGIIIAIIALAFLVRAALHALTGWRTLRAFNPTRFRMDCDRYFGVAVLTTVLICLLMLISSLQAGLVGFISVVPVAALSMLWPSLVRNVGAVEVRPDLEDEPPPIRSSRDNGVVTLGMVLIGMVALSVGVLWAARQGAQVSMGGLTQQPLWLSAISLALTLWAGLECVGMTPRRKLATIIYLVSAVLGVGYGLVQLLGMIGDVPVLRGMGNQLLWISLFSAVTSLALPVIVAWQVLRKDAGQPVDVEAVF
jgi:hypothetical protein